MPSGASAHGRPSAHAAAVPAPRRGSCASLLAAFAAWKAFLLLVAAAATLAGPAYDTSAGLLGAAHAAGRADGLATRLTSWDAVYFVQSARRGYVYEQEWAFAKGLPLVVSALRRGTAALGLAADVSVLAIGVSHVAHALSVLALYRLGCLVWPGEAGRRTALVAAYLHILSPAGLFLSAPYAESAFALLSFAGHLALAAGSLRDPSPRPVLAGDLLRLLAGLLYGAACLFRSNGLLHGIPFACEAIAGGVRFVRAPSWPALRRLVAVGLGGAAVAAGIVGPQAVAYRQYCTQPSGRPGEVLRPWCSHVPPSIYAFVQKRYWNTGLFRYWTVSNIPLFLLAGTMLCVLAWSSLDTWSETAPAARKQAADALAVHPQLVPFMRYSCAAQLVLAGLAVTSYHVQIITRLSSAYPVWYWWLARNLAGGPRAGVASKVVVYMVMYASIQGVLFSSFLPPA